MGFSVGMINLSNVPHHWWNRCIFTFSDICNIKRYLPYDKLQAQEIGQLWFTSDSFYASMIINQIKVNNYLVKNIGNFTILEKIISNPLFVCNERD
jgi:hypothetical protein